MNKCHKHTCIYTFTLIPMHNMSGCKLVIHVTLAWFYGCKRVILSLLPQADQMHAEPAFHRWVAECLAGVPQRKGHSGERGSRRAGWTIPSNTLKELFVSSSCGADNTFKHYSRSSA